MLKSWPIESLRIQLDLRHLFSPSDAYTSLTDAHACTFE